MAREKKVVDASIVVKWFVDEDGSEEALSLRADHVAGRVTLVVPELLFLEVLNTLRYKGGTTETLAVANKALSDIQFHVEKLNVFLLEKACQLALEHTLSLYDATYLALGAIHGSVVVTADEKLAKAANTSFLK